MKYRNIKIRVNPENSAAVQERLFEDGCGWPPGFVNVAQKTEEAYLYIDSMGAIRRSAGDESFFKLHNHKEITVQQILDPFYDLKKAWANGEALQFKISDEWMDWIGKDDLALSAGADWRIKPKTQDIYLWERQFETNGLIVTLASLNHQDPMFQSKDKNWITEVYGKEYEKVSY